MMKRCDSCNKLFPDTDKFCSNCATQLVDVVACPHCGKEFEKDNVAFCSNVFFCSNCGTRLNDEPKTEKPKKTNVKSVVQNSAEKIKENEFVKSIKNDLKNSESVSIVKEKVKNAAVNVKEKSANVSSDQMKKIGIIGGVLAVIIVFVVLLASIHSCEECGETYVGKKHEVTYLGETENLCKDCYNDFYSWF